MKSFSAVNWFPLFDWFKSRTGNTQWDSSMHDSNEICEMAMIWPKQSKDGSKRAKSKNI